MNKILLISPTKCKDCGTCESVCGNAAISVIDFEAGDRTFSVPVTCMQCEDAACMEICPTGALWRDAEGNVAVDGGRCVGCRLCVGACPFGNIQYSRPRKRVMKCDLCGGAPDCAKYCPTRAIEYVDGTESNLGKKRAVAAKFLELFE
jgi:Fe-S-cluster-containing hydrogenase component 2